MAEIAITDQDLQNLANTLASENTSLRLENVVLRRTVVELEAAAATEDKPNTPSKKKT